MSTTTNFWRGEDLKRAEEILHSQITDSRSWDLKGFYYKYKTNEQMLLTFLKKGGSLTANSGKHPDYLAKMAAQHGHIDLFNYMADNKIIDISSEYYGDAPIDYAMKHNQHAMFKMLYLNDKVIKNNDSHKIYYSKVELMQHPLLGYCPNIESGFSINKSLLSSSYSKIITKAQLEKDLVEFAKHPVLSDILYTVAISSNSRPLTIELVGDMKQYNPNSNAVGYMHNHANRIVISGNSELDLKKSTFMHELTHKAMILLFDDSSANPYKTSNQREKYQEALKKVFVSIRNYFTEEYSLETKFEESDNIRQMGKKLAEAYLFLTVGVYKLVKETDGFDILKQHPEFDVNKKIFNDTSLVELSFLFNNYSLLKAILNDNRKIENILIDQLIKHLSIAAFKNDSESVKSIIQNIPNIAYKYLERIEDMVNLAKYSGNTEIADLLENYANQNTTWYNYFASFIPTITIKSIETSLSQDNKESVLKAIYDLLSANIATSYGEFDQDKEFIANFVGLIADGKYFGKIEEITKPVREYFDTEIHGAFLEYQQTKDLSLVCLPETDYGDIS